MRQPTGDAFLFYSDFFFVSEEKDIATVNRLNVTPNAEQAFARVCEIASCNHLEKIEIRCKPSHPPTFSDAYVKRLAGHSQTSQFYIFSCI
jgi:hypothetical protein